MASVFDVAKYILSKQGALSTMKLQKLAYYSQAWSLVWDEKPLFAETFHAWANGPVCPALFEQHRGQFQLSEEQLLIGDKNLVSADERWTIDVVLEFYGDKDAHWLSNQTHSEPPWKSAREGLQPDERGNCEITHGAMLDYYSTLS